MKVLTLVIGMFLSNYAFATLPLHLPLEEVVADSDHLLVGHIIDVDMINGKGEQITNPDAMTGPGSQNTIRLVTVIDEVIISPNKSVPKTLNIPLDRAMHYKFSQVKSAFKVDSSQFLLLLKGKDFDPPFAGLFKYSLSNKEEIVALMTEKIPEQNEKVETLKWRVIE